MRRGGIDFLAEGVADMAARSVTERYEKLVRDGVSPIEALFEVALVGGLNANILMTGRMPLYFSTLEKLPEPAPPRTFYVVRQARVLDWPIDFLVCASDDAGKLHRAAVECDGHEFHERTKEQAERDRSRDRRLQAAGLTVFRFTGRELHRDALDCVGEIAQWAADCAGGKRP